MDVLFDVLFIFCAVLKYVADVSLLRTSQSILGSTTALKTLASTAERAGDDVCRAAVVTVEAERNLCSNSLRRCVEEGQRFGSDYAAESAEGRSEAVQAFAAITKRAGIAQTKRTGMH